MLKTRADYRTLKARFFSNEAWMITQLILHMQGWKLTIIPRKIHLFLILQWSMIAIHSWFNIRDLICIRIFLYLFLPYTPYWGQSFLPSVVFQEYLTERLSSRSVSTSLTWPSSSGTEDTLLGTHFISWGVAGLVSRTSSSSTTNMQIR